MEAIITCGKNITSLRKRIRSLQSSPWDSDASDDEILHLERSAEQLNNALKKEQEKEKQLRRELGVNNRTGLAKLAHRPYFTARMNARTLKARIRARVREHKEELDPIQRSVERSSSSTHANYLS